MIAYTKQYVEEVSDLIKNLLTFCKYKVAINAGEISLFCSKMILKK